jgi:hypothetical protein
MSYSHFSSFLLKTLLSVIHTFNKSVKEVFIEMLFEVPHVLPAHTILNTNRSTYLESGTGDLSAPL